MAATLLIEIFSFAPAAGTPRSDVRPNHSSPAAKAVYYDFKGARLGMSLAEWRALPPPSTTVSAPDKGIEEGPDQPVCIGDGEGDSTLLNVRTTAESKANVLVCGYAHREKLFGTTGVAWTHVGWIGAAIPIGELSAQDVQYKFLDGSLYEISITGDAGLLDEVMSGLRAKWGEPTSVINDATQNKLGATFPHSVRTWANPVAAIRVETPFHEIESLNVTYVTIAGLAKLTAIEKATNPDMDKM